MTRTPAPVKRIIGSMMVAAALALGAFGGTPSYAGPINQYPIAGGSVTQDSARQSEHMMDPIPCPALPGRHPRSGSPQAGCPGPYDDGAQIRTSRRPGPSAFGLQFDSGDY